MKTNEKSWYQCPLCGKGKVDKKRTYLDKIEKAKKLRGLGFSIREIMRALNYKSPRSVQIILNQSLNDFKAK